MFMKKIKKQFAFTIVELLVAMGLLAVIMTASGFIFHIAIKSQRIAKATLEITQKLRTITTQLDADFKNIRKDGIIFMGWTLSPVDHDGDGLSDGYDSFDRIMFFANGNYQTYNEYDHDNDGITPPEVLSGNVARITYMLASDADLYGSPPELYPAQWQQPADRILARSQHILIKDPALDPFPDFGNIPLLDWTANMNNRDYLIAHNKTYEYDNAAIDDWNNALPSELQEMFTLATDIMPIADPTRGGLVVTADGHDPLHMLLCEGVGTFSVQRWYGGPQRWWPQIDVEGDGNLNPSVAGADGSDFTVDPADPTRLEEPVQGWHLPYIADEPHFNWYFGGALKFTFTLYDPMGIFPDGKTFTHIVYLDD